MCVISGTVAGAALANATLAIGAITTATSVGMQMYSAQQQAAQAQASMNMQAQQQQQQAEMQRQQMQMQQQQQRQAQIQNQQQQQQALALQQSQAAANYNLQIAQNNTSILNQYQQQRQQVEAERRNIQQKYSADRIGFQRQTETANQQVKYNNDAANEVYKREQTKMTEAKRKAAFARQNAMARAIGARGSILSAGRTGQSVGLLLNDAERQAGFEQAQADATLQGQLEMAQIGMDQGFLQSQSANNQAMSNVGMFPAAPYMPAFPGIPNFVDPFSNNQEQAFGAA